MPTIKLNRKEVEKIIGKKLSTEELKDRIIYLGTALEGITDDEIEVEIFPNRPDMLSDQGFARALASFIGAKPGLREYSVKPSGEKVIIERSVSKVRPYTACAIVKNLHFDDSRIKEVIQIQEKLHITFGRNRKKAAIGIYPCEKIKMPIRFVARKPEEIVFRPLEFPREINGAQILSQHPTGREYGHLLEGLDHYPIFIDSNNQILSMPPIINSHHTGKVTEETKEVFIECSGFDFNVLQKCLNMIVCALADMGGEIYSMELYYPDGMKVTPDLKPFEMDIDVNYVNERIGINLKENELQKYLSKMGYGYKNKKVLVPAYRTDVLHQIDLVEDIAIAYGYENIDPIIPKIASNGGENKFEMFKNLIAELLCNLSFMEVHTYHLTNNELQTKMMNVEVETIKLANSISSEYNFLRSWIIPSVLEVLKNNKHNEYPQKIFNIGGVFKKNEREETGVLEQDLVAVAVCGEYADYTSIRQVLDYLFRSLSVEYIVESNEHNSFIQGRFASVFVKGKEVAYLGEIAPEVLSNFSLEMPVACLEINLTELYDLID